MSDDFAAHIDAPSPWHRIADTDDVAVALRNLAAGDRINIGDELILLRDAIPSGHKFAVRAVDRGAPVNRYREQIGIATLQIALGDHVHTHNVRTALLGEDSYRYRASAQSPKETTDLTHSFLGYARANGSVGTRNEVWILPTVGCVGRLSERLATAASAMADGRIDGVHAFNHPFGCSQLGADHDATAAILAALALNPNAGGVLLVGLGCESNQLDALLARIPIERHARIRVLSSQLTTDEFAAGIAAIDELIALAEQDKRTAVPLARLCIGVKCGGSDGMSGLTANPAIGRVADLVTQSGGYVVLTEIPEMFGAERLLMARAANIEVFNRLGIVVNRFKRYFLDHGEPVSENPSPGNIAGGITTLEEKSLGAVQKGGVSIIVDVVDYGERLRNPGLTVLEAPGNDAVSTTALAAAGATITLFSTGRGTPLGSPVPTLKIASNEALAKAKPGWIDFDASRSLDIGIASTGNELLNLVIETASGRLSRNEINDERSIGIWKRGVTL